MTFGYQRNSGISWFRDYGDALHKYENTTDIRGRVEEPKRPLGHRKSVDMYSIRKKDNADIECVLYRTPVVTFHTDNTVSIWHDTWASQTTANFIPEVMGYGVSARVYNHKLCLYVHGKEYFIPAEGLRLKREGEEWAVINAPKNVVHYIVRKESNNVMKPYAEFISYMENVRKLRTEEKGAVFPKTEFEMLEGDDAIRGSLRRHDYQYFPKLITNFVSYIDDQSEHKYESYYKALLLLVNTVSAHSWHTEERHMRAEHWLEAKNLLKNVLWGVHRDKVFTECGVAQGIVKRDTYGRFFESGWNRFHENKGQSA